MRAIVEINPPGGDNRYAGWIDVSARILPPAVIRHQYESSGWDYGVASVSFGKFYVDNHDGFLSPADDHRSVFNNATVPKTRLRVRYGGTPDVPERVVFLGYVSGRTSESDILKNRSQLIVKSIGGILDDLDAKQTIGFANSRETKTRETFFTDLFAVPEIVDVVGHGNVETLFDARGEDFEPTHSAFAGGFYYTADLIRDGDSVLDVINRILQIEDAVLLYNYRRNVWVVTQRGRMPGPATVVVQDVIETLEEDDGSKKMVNEVTFTNAPQDPQGQHPRTTHTFSNDASIDAWGLKKVSMDVGYVDYWYYTTRLFGGFTKRTKYPQIPARHVKFVVDANAPNIPEHWWGLGELVYMDVKPLANDEVPTVGNDKPLAPVTVRREVFDPRVPVDGIGVLGKWKQAPGVTPQQTTLWHARPHVTEGIQIRMSADGSANPKFGYLTQVRAFPPTTGRPSWSVRFSLHTAPGASSDAGIQPGPHFDPDYLTDLRFLFRWKTTNAVVQVPRSAVSDPYSVIPGAGFDSFMQAILNDVAINNPGEVEIALVDVKANNVEPTDPSRIVLAELQRGERLPVYVAGLGDDVTKQRRSA